jgi:hypothetical protein
VEGAPKLSLIRWQTTRRQGTMLSKHWCKRWRDRRWRIADRLKEAKKDSKTTVLEWQGNILNYFDVLDKIEALDKCRPISEEKKMGMLLDAVIDAEYRQTVLQLRREIKNKSLTSCKELFSEIQTVETHLETGETEEQMKPPASVLRRSKEQQDSGSGPDSAGDHDKGGSTNLKASELRLPK